MKASDLLVRCLEREGVRYVFGLPGEENLDFLESLRSSSIELVITRHEQHAAFMAATYGRLSGQAGVCLSTLGPGALNLLTGIAQANLCQFPLVAITGQKPIRENEQAGFQLLDIVATIRPLAQWNSGIWSASTIPRLVRHAFQVAQSPPAGATHLELPEDVAREQTDGYPQTPNRMHSPLASQSCLAEAAQMIAKAHHPVLLLASGAASRPGICRAVEHFVERTGIYAVATQMGKGVLPEDHERSLLSLGINARDYTHRALVQADLVITLGLNIREHPPSIWNPRKDATIVHLGFVAAEPDEFYDPCLEVVGDLEHSMRYLAEHLTDTSFEQSAFAQLRSDVRAALEEFGREEVFPLSPARVVRSVRAHLGREDIVCLDNGIYKLWFARLYEALAPNTLLLDNALATMGAGLAGAMASKLVHPQRRVLAVVGDGGFMMNSQDLETAMRMNLNVVVLVLRDDAYGFIRFKQQRMGHADYGMSFNNPDLVRYAQAYGATGLRVGAFDELDSILEQAFEHSGPVLIDCPIDYTFNEQLP